MAEMNCGEVIHRYLPLLGSLSPSLQSILVEKNRLLQCNADRLKLIKLETYLNQIGLQLQEKVADVTEASETGLQ